MRFTKWIVSAAIIGGLEADAIWSSMRFSNIKEILEIPKKFRVLGLTPLGYPLKLKGEITDRKSLEEIVHYEKF